MIRRARIGIIGGGRIGQMHARNLSARTDVEKVVLLGRDASRTAKAAAALGADLQADGGHRGAIAQRTGEVAEIEVRTFATEACTDLDGLIVATPTATRLQVVEAAAGAGVPLLVEKPLALSLRDQHHLLRLLEEAHVPCMVGFQRRFDPGYRALREAVRSGRLGPLRAIIAINGDYLDADEAFVPTSGGMWRDQAIHDFDILPWLTGEEAVSVWATSGVLNNPMYERYGDVDTGTAVVTFASGLQATVLCGRNLGSGQETRTEIHGTSGAVGTGLGRHSTVRSVDEAPAAGAGVAAKDSAARFADAFANEIEAFLDLVDGRGHNESPAKESPNSLRLALAVEESCRTGQPVDL